MNKRERARHIGQRIKEIYSGKGAAVGVVVCWNEAQCRKHGEIKHIPDTIGFAYSMVVNDTQIKCVIPIAKRVLYAEDKSGAIETSLLKISGRFIINHIHLMASNQSEEI